MTGYEHSYFHSRGSPANVVPAGLVLRSSSEGSTMPPGVMNDTDKKNISSFAHGLSGVEQADNYLFVHVLIASFAVLCLLTLILRVGKLANARLRRLSVLSSPRQQKFWMTNNNDWWPSLKKHLLYAPLWKVRHNREFKLNEAVTVGTLPSRFHTLLLVAYVACNIAYCLVLPWHEGTSEAVVAALRGRSGILAAINLIPTFLFAMRNNPFIWALQVSYDTFNLFHRWTARMVVLETLVHTFAWLYNTRQAGGSGAVSKSLHNNISYQWGLVATVAFVFIVIQAYGPIRHASYEIFLNLHRFLILLGVIGVYVHLDTHKLPQLPWIGLVIFFWVFEWFLRTLWILRYNVNRKNVTKVSVEAMPGEACRVTFDLVRPWTPRPGCHVHVYLPIISLWSSHPFSVAWAEPRASPSEEGKLPSNTAELDRGPPTNATTRVSLVCRARTGMTRKLLNKALTYPTATFTTWGAIEGPYGGHESLASYGTVLLFAAGVGITHQISYVRELLAGHSAGTVAAQRIALVWSVPNTEALEWVRPWMDEILRMPGRRDVLRVLLFVSKPRSPLEVQSGTGTVHMFPGRCTPQTVLDNEIVERVGAMCVTVCGPGAFADSVRAAVRKRVEAGSIDFIEEAFTY